MEKIIGIKYFIEQMVTGGEKVSYVNHHMLGKKLSFQN